MELAYVFRPVVVQELLVDRIPKHVLQHDRRRGHIRLPPDHGGDEVRIRMLHAVVRQQGRRDVEQRGSYNFV